MLGLREMFEHLSRMYEVEGSMLQRIGGDVVPAHLQVLLRELLKEAGLQVGGNYGAGRCYLLAKPPSDRACSGSNLKAAPPRSHADCCETSDRGGVEASFDRSEALAFVFPRVLELIAHGLSLGRPSGSGFSCNRQR